MRFKIVLFIIVLFLPLFLLSFGPVSALSLSDLVDGIKSVFNKNDQNIHDKKFTIESNITLAPDGDVNKNGEIDAGDIVRFSYVLTNTTDKSYSFATLKTNIDRKQLNFIHSLSGATGLMDDDKTINITNVRIEPQQTLVISFDVRTLYRNDDISVSTEAEFENLDKKLIFKSSKVDKLVKKNLPESNQIRVQEKIKEATSEATQ